MMTDAAENTLITGTGDSQSKTAIVTGGTRGIGKAISEALAASGMQVFAIYARNRKAAESAAEEWQKKGLDIVPVKADLTRDEMLSEAVDTILERAKKIHTVVHAAASGVHKEVEDLTPKHFAWTFSINVFAFQKLMHKILPSLESGGRVIGVTSLGGQKTIPFYAAVGSSKGALESLIRHYAVELAPKGITANLVCPGMVMTDAVESFPNKEERIEKTLSGTPTGKLTTPQQVADCISFLCSDAAQQIVGQTLVVDGGKSLQA